MAAARRSPTLQGCRIHSERLKRRYKSRRWEDLFSKPLSLLYSYRSVGVSPSSPAPSLQRLFNFSLLLSLRDLLFHFSLNFPCFEISITWREKLISRWSTWHTWDDEGSNILCKIDSVPVKIASCEMFISVWLYPIWKGRKFILIVIIAMARTCFVHCKI